MEKRKMMKRITGMILFILMMLQITSLARTELLYVEHMKTDNYPNGIYANGDFAFVSTRLGVEVYDISDSDNIEYYASINVNASSVVADEKRVYIAHATGCGFISLSNIKKGETNKLTALYTSSAYGVGVKDNYVFISGAGDDPVVVRDMNRPRYPIVAKLGSDYEGILFKRNMAYVAKNGSYHIYDLSTYAGETTLEGFKKGTVPILTDVSCIDFKDNYVFMANQMYPSVDNFVYAYKINANGTSTELWGESMRGQYGTRISDIAVRGNFLYVAGQDVRGIYLFNIENPEAGADVIAKVESPSGNDVEYSIALADDKILLADGTDGVGIFSVADALSGRADNFIFRLHVARVGQEITTLMGNQVYATLNADNYTMREIAGKFMLAAYSGEKLVSLKTKDIVLEPCTMKQSFNVGNVATELSEGYKVKAMFWEDSTPVMKNITVEYTDEEIRTEFYVDGVNGRDSYNGTEAAPFATIERARYEVRKVSRNMKKDITVYIKDGVYKADETIEFTGEDSGNNGYNVIYKAAEGANPIISGGEKITGWTLHDAGKNIYKASAKGIYTRQFYVNGVRATRARSSGGLSGLSLSSEGMTCSNTEILNYAHPEELEFVFKAKWLLPRIKAVSVSNSNGKCYIEMQQPYFTNSVNDPVYTTRISSPWYYENAYELLDSAGEFYIDQYTDTIYYKPRTGENMLTADAYLPKIETILSIKGSSMEYPAKNIVFEGLTFAHSAWNQPQRIGNVTNQNNKGIIDGDDTTLAVLAERVKDITIKKCTFKNLGGGGLGMYSGCQDCDIIGNEFYDISAWAMDIGEIDNPNPKDDRLINDGFEIANNYIHDIGVEYMGAAAMTLGHVSNTIIRNNELYNLPYSGIHIGWGFTVYPTTNLKGITISNNYIHELVNVLNDGGAIYTNGASGATNDNPNWILRNYCKDQHGATSLIYTDEGACYWLAEQNVLDTRTGSCYYGSTHEYNIHDVTYLNNYTTSSSKLNNGGANCIYTGTWADSSATWDGTAQWIISQAGLEAEYQYLKN